MKQRFSKVSLAQQSGLFYWVELILLKPFAPSVILMLPWLGHLNGAYHIFANLKHYKHRTIQIDCQQSPLIDHGSLHSPTALDFSAIYPDATKEIDSLLLTAKPSWRLLLLLMQTMHTIGNLIILCWVSFFCWLHSSCLD
jgi:hypothetical protein